MHLLRNITALVLSGACCAVLAGEPNPKFAEPKLSKQSNNYCSETNTTVSLSPDAKEITMIWGDTRFLDIGKAGAPPTHNRCEFDIMFDQALKTPTSMQIHLRGNNQKSPQTEISYHLNIGNQRHEFQLSAGRLIDGQDNDYNFTRIFQLTDLPAGTRKVHVAITGKAKSLNGKDWAYVDLGSLDMCFIKPDSTNFCGQMLTPEQKSHTLLKQ